MKLKWIVLPIVSLALLAGSKLALEFSQDDVQLFAKGKITERGTSRIAFWQGRSGQGQVVLSYGRPLWNDRFARMFEAWKTEGRLMRSQGGYWRIGNNYWTTLDTSLPVTISGTRIPPGHYYLAVSRPESGQAEWPLLVIDPEKARQEYLDPFELVSHPDQLAILFRTPLRYRETAEHVEKLTAELRPETKAGTQAVLRIAFARWELTAPVEIELPVD